MAVQICLLAGHNKRGPEVLAYVTAMQPGHEVRLVRDPTNQFDKNAIQVHVTVPSNFGGGATANLVIGFIAKAHNRRAAAWMDADASRNPMAAVFGYAGTGKSKVPAIQITFPEEVTS